MKNIQGWFLNKVLSFLKFKIREELTYQLYMRKHGLRRSFFNGYDIRIYGKDLVNHGTLSVGLGSYVGANTKIQILPGSSVTIGKDCGLGRNLNIITSTRIAAEWIQGRAASKQGNIIIGNSVWIGVNCTILPNTEIGNNAVIPANSVVKGRIKSNEVYGRKAANKC